MENSTAHEEKIEALKELKNESKNNRRKNINEKADSSLYSKKKRVIRIECDEELDKEI